MALDHLLVQLATESGEEFAKRYHDMVEAEAIGLCSVSHRIRSDRVIRWSIRSSIPEDWNFVKIVDFAPVQAEIRASAIV